MYNNPKYKYQFYAARDGGDSIDIPDGPLFPPTEETNNNIKKPKKNLITALKSALVTLGIGSEENYNNKNLVKNLKELAVVARAADSTEDINSNSAVEVLDYIAENGESIVYPEPTGTKRITTNGTHDVIQFANVEVNVPESIIPQLTIQNDSNTLMSIYGSLGTLDGYTSLSLEIPISSGYSKPVGIGRYKVGINTVYTALFRLRIGSATKTADEFDFKYNGQTVATWYYALNNGSESIYYGYISITAEKLNKSLVISDK